MPYRIRYEWVDPATAIGALVMETITAKGLTPRQVAEQIDCSVEAVRAIIRGTNRGLRPRRAGEVPTLWRTTRFLGIPDGTVKQLLADDLVPTEYAGDARLADAPLRGSALGSAA